MASGAEPLATGSTPPIASQVTASCGHIMQQRSPLPPAAGGTRRPSANSGAQAAPAVTSTSSAAVSSSSGGGSSTEASRLEPEVSALLGVIVQSFNSLVSPSTTVVGQLEEAERTEEDGDAVMSGSTAASSAVQAVPLSPATLPYELLHTQSLLQQAVLQSSAATLLDSCERLLGVLSQLRLHRVLHDRTRYGDEGRRRRDALNKQRDESARMRRQLGDEVRLAIEQLEQHYHTSLQHRYDQRSGVQQQHASSSVT